MSRSGKEAPLRGSAIVKLSVERPLHSDGLMIGWNIPMDAGFSLSLFTLEINGRPTLAFQAKRHKDAESLCEQENFRADLSGLTSNRTPLWDVQATMKIRLSNAEEATIYRRATESIIATDYLVYLINIDGK